MCGPGDVLVVAPLRPERTEDNQRAGVHVDSEDRGQRCLFSCQMGSSHRVLVHVPLVELTIYARAVSKRLT